MPYRSWLLLFPFVLLGVTTTGCDESPPVLRPDASMPMGDPATYWDDVAPLVQRECLSCHVAGGVAPFPLTTFEELVDEAESVVSVVEAGTMPPWMPDNSCRELADAKGLAAEERDVFRRWLDHGMQEGTPRMLPPIDGPPPFVPTDVARMPEPYLPDASRPDDYRCFVLDLDIEEETYVTGRRVIPGAGALVHHVLTYAVPPALMDSVTAADAAEPGPGYTCFGGPLASGDGEEAEGSTLALVNLGGWVPGALPSVAEPGSALRIPAGSRIVMQVHYNLLGGEPVMDDTSLELTLSDVEPTTQLTSSPLAILDFSVPAGAPASSHEQVFWNHRETPIEVTAATPHMHLLGTQIGLELVPAEGDAECLLDIPRWDFNWQQSYRYPEPITVPPGAGLRLTCTYDNSETNQPTVNGEQLEPRTVTWGEGTLDEMCLLYVQEARPFGGAAPVGCENADTCFDGCADEDAACLLRCRELGPGCRPCMLSATLGCAQTTCQTEFTVPFINGCLQECISSYATLGGSFEACMEAQCPADTWAPLRACLSAEVASGSCDEAITGCGITRP